MIQPENSNIYQGPIKQWASLMVQLVKKLPAMQET